LAVVVNAAAFCYIERRMRQFTRSASSPRWPAALMAVIIGSLCFSVGEGLRLAPFPVSQVAQTNDLGPVSAKYGPVDVPSPVQKRTKRHSTDFASEPVPSGSQAIAFLRYYTSHASIRSRSLAFVFRPPGRAPPAVS